MAALYPESLPSVLATKRTSKVAPFSMAQPRRGTPYVEPTGTDTPTIFEVEWLLQPHEAVALRDWVYVVLAGGSLPFRMPLRTEDGVRLVTGTFMPDGLLDRQRVGTLWRYRATIVARDGLGIVPPTIIDGFLGSATASGAVATITLAAGGGAAPVANFYALPTGAASFEITSGFDANGASSSPLIQGAYELAVEAQNAFVAATGAGAPQTFESFTAPGPLGIVYTDTGSGAQVTITGTSGSLEVQAAGTAAGGRYSVGYSDGAGGFLPADGGSQFVAIRGITGDSVTFAFSKLVGAFGAYLIDYLDFGGTATWKFFNGTTEVYSGPISNFLSNIEREGSVGFVGFRALTHAARFNRVEISYAGNLSNDLTAFDNLFVAALEQLPVGGVAAGTALQFTDTSTNSPTSWSWNFGDSTTSTAQNPTKTYSTPGTYTVTLTATNAAGSDSETKTGYIVVT